MPGRLDARWFQIGVLGCLLFYGTLALDFEVAPGGALAGLAACLATQALCQRARGERFEPKSALISGLSLALLLRTRDPLLAAAAGALAVGSKFALRWRGKHVFNPTNFGVVALLALSERVWISAGQWGSAALLAFAFAGAGTLVLSRTQRADATWGFLVCWSGLLVGRALWLGDPLAIPIHQLSNGGLLLFAFFMLSDPRTLPDARAARLVFAACIAALAYSLQFRWRVQNPLLWSLFACAPLSPVLDAWLPAARFAWRGVATHKENPVPAIRSASTLRHSAAGLLALALWLVAEGAHAFCGFYVARGDAKLFNRASQVVLARDGERTVITMSSDFRGEPREFALVVPVPTFVTREQIHVAEQRLIDHLDAFTAPRLVEYFDPDPCAPPILYEMSARATDSALAAPAMRPRSAKAHGVTIEARYTVGEYDILILSAKQSDGLVRWLRENDYRIPDGAEPILGSYLKQQMRFFVARVNLEQHAKLGAATLRPLQIAFESSKFMLPIRLGTVNADGPQELFVYALTRKGRVEPTNYRSVKLPSDVEIPPYVKAEFADFYRALFDVQVERERMTTVFTEYAWDLGWCDPCAADPLSREELRELGVFWQSSAPYPGAPVEGSFVTRLHLRYDAAHFPADLQFQETGDRENFQGRYVLRNPFTGAATCEAGDAYRRDLRARQEREAQTLASLTGWDLPEIRKRIGFPGVPSLGAGPDGAPWWRALWD